MEEELNYPNLERICRLCLKEDSAKVEIFLKDKISTGRQISLPMRIMACVALEVQTSDGLPKLICNDCRYQLEKSFYFRKRAQFSDSKLRKHIRLLSAGKVSRVFVKDEDDDDELELEDSLLFIKAQEQIHNQNKAQEDEEKLRLEFEAELAEVKKMHENDLKERCAALKAEALAEAKITVHNEVIANLREKIRDECIAAAKNELRAQMRDECRKIEMEHLLNDLEMYLQQKRKPLRRSTILNLKRKSQKTPISCNNKSDIVVSESKVMKRNCHSENGTPKVLRLRKRENSSQEKCSEIVLEKISQESYDVIEKQVAKLDDNESRETEGKNFFILDSDSNDERTEFIESIEDATYVGSDGEQYPIITADNNDTETALYQIEEISEIQSLEKEGENVLYLNMDVGDEEQVDDVMDYVNSKLNKSKGTTPTTTVYATTKAKDVTKITGFTKVSINNNDNKTDSEQDDQTKLPYSRPTDTPKTFKCEMCPMSFSTINALNRHYRAHENSEKRGITYECPECHVVFSCRSALNRHAVIHTGERPYKCDECGKAFVQREILKRHQQVHTGERPYRCPHCSHAYTQKVNLQQHINHKHSKMPKLHQHSCHLCPKRFNHASGLSRHLTSHSGISYQCMECDRSFSDRSSVKRHVLSVHMTSGGSTDLVNKLIKECVDINDDVKHNNETSE